jgi:DNA-binding transcriptional regulator YdaS (Cro superfamily)
MCIKFKSMKAFHMQLFEWLPANGVSQRMFAPRINVSQPTLSRYLKGLTIPNAITAAKIAEVTGGEVTMEDWVKLPSIMNAEIDDV